MYFLELRFGSYIFHYIKIWKYFYFIPKCTFLLRKSSTNRMRTLLHPLKSPFAYCWRVTLFMNSIIDVDQCSDIFRSGQQNFKSRFDNNDDEIISTGALLQQWCSSAIHRVMLASTKPQQGKHSLEETTQEVETMEHSRTVLHFYSQWEPTGK